MLVDYAARILNDRARAEDIVHDAWMQFNLHSEREPIRDPEGYLRRVVRNLAIDTLRRSIRYGRIAGESMEEAERTVEDDQPGAERVLAARQTLERVMRGLGALPEKQRIAIEMHRIGGFRLKDIAERLGVSVPYVHTLIAKGLASCDEFRDDEL